MEARPLLRAVEAGERTGTGGARPGEAAAEEGPEAAPRSASRRRQSPAAACLESPEARLGAENCFPEDFFLFLAAEGPTGGRSSMPDSEGEVGRTGMLEHAPDKGVPFEAAAAAGPATVPGTEP